MRVYCRKHAAQRGEFMSEEADRTAVMPSVGGPQVPAQSKVALLVSKGPAEAPVPSSDVPDVIGQKQAEALQALQTAGFQVEVVRSSNTHFKNGTVSHQLPVGGSAATGGSRVCIVSSTGPAPEAASMASLPETVGKKRDEAVDLVSAAGLSSVVIEEYSQTVPEGTVFAQEPNARTYDREPQKKNSVWLWAVLALVVAAIAGYFLFFTGADIAVPDVTGMPLEEAEAAIVAADLEVGEVTGEVSEEAEPGTVLSQDPTAGEKVAAGSSVNLVVASDEEDVEVPDVVLMDLESAEAELGAAGLSVGRVTEESSDDEEPGTVLAQSPEAGSKALPGSRVDLTVARGIEGVEVPDVVGMALAQATSALEGADLKVRSEETYSSDVDSGIVITQSPQAGIRVQSGAEIALSVSKGPEPAANVKVPDLAGLPQAQAKTRIQQAGLVSRVVEMYSETIPSGNVITQSPAAASSVAPGTTVAIVVSRGQAPQGTEYVKVPDVAGKTRTEGKAALVSAGFVVTELEADSATVPKDKVLGQMPLAGQKAPKGSAVLIVISVGVPAE